MKAALIKGICMVVIVFVASMPAYSSVERSGGDSLHAIYEKVAPALVFITNKERDTFASGFVARIGEHIFILSNRHVLPEDETRADVHFVVLDKEGRMRKERRKFLNVLRRDTRADLMLIALDEELSDRYRTVALEFADTRIAIGDRVCTLGNPFGIIGAFSCGVISNILDRIEYKARMRPEWIGGRNLLQTDAMIIGGNSGGPLINMDGKVVGINTALLTTGMGFAITGDDARAFAEEAFFGKMRPLDRKAQWSGVVLEQISMDLYDTLRAKLDRFVRESVTENSFVVSYVAPESAASEIFKKGDVIYRVDGKPFFGSRHAFKEYLLRERRSGTVSFDVIRQFVPMTFVINLAAIAD